MPAASEKQLDALGRYALKLVKPGQVLGLGTGRAASAFIKALGESGVKVRGVPTSNGSAELGRSVGIEVVELSDVARIDIDFDGADEVDSRLNLIKGYGGALVREKIVVASSRRFVVLVGEEKVVPRLGTRGSLPVEIVPFALPLVTRAVKSLGLKALLREKDGQTFRTDNGNFILDCKLKPIANAAKLDRDLLAIPGVVGTGIFIGMSDIVLIANADGTIKTLRPKS
ncbi:MAG TPA: ribose-5-phosphate isomerase RpiA [Candidatus Binataceae bacterium]|nr:ribose-5-phosphate isomerase RpiA [Candidatus Binataceae bacterium]